MRLALKLSLGMVAGIIIALAIDGYIEVNRQVEVYETDIERDLGLEARALAAAMAKLWTAFDEEGAVQVLRSANDPTFGTRARLLPVRGLLQIPTGTFLQASDLPHLAAGSSVVRLVEGPGASRGVYAYSPVRVGGGTLGVLELSRPAVPLDRFVRERLGRSAATIGILAVLTWIMAMSLGARLVGQPVDALIGKARRAGRGDFSGPLVLERKDELSALAGAINEMCDQLDAAQKRLQREVAARLTAMNQLRRADRLTTVGRLAAGIAHELGTPLNVISERVKMLAHDELDPDERPPTFQVILSQLDRITTTIRQLLDFSRQREPEKLRVDLVDLASKTAELLTPIAEKSGIEVEVHGPTEPALEDVDPSQLQQVLTNLMVNGIQASDRGGKLTVTVGRARAHAPGDGPERDWWTITVEDTGHGIPRHLLPHVFEPFFTTKGVGEGTGLGLSVSLGIVEEHGGFIAAESEPQKGSRFTVNLPVGGEA